MNPDDFVRQLFEKGRSLADISKLLFRNQSDGKQQVLLILGFKNKSEYEAAQEEIRKQNRSPQEIEIDVPSFNILGAPVGSPLWNELVENGFIDEDEYWEEGVYVSKVVSTAVPFEEISSMIWDYFKAFYSDPKRLLSEFLRMFTSSFRLGLLFGNLTNLTQTVRTVKRGVQFK